MMNDLESLFDAKIEESISVKRELKLDLASRKLIVSIANSCINALASGGKIIFAGNGGSFGDAQHLAAEFVSRLVRERQPLASYALGTNSSAMSAVSNDYGYEFVFARELDAILDVNDVVVLISTSGNSRNIINAAKVSRDAGVVTFGFTGRTGGELATICECLKVPSDDTARIQECHILLGHILVELTEAPFFK